MTAREFFVHTAAKDIRVTLERRGACPIFHALFWHAGRRHRHSTHCAVLSQATAKARTLVLEALEAQPHGGALTLGAAIAKYLAARWPAVELDEPRAPNRRNRSREDAGGRLKALIAKCGADTDLAALNYDQAVALVQKLLAEKRKDGNGARSLINLQSVVSRFFKFLLNARDERGRPLVPWRFNPADRKVLDLESPGDVLLPSLTDAETDRFIAAARSRVRTKSGSRGRSVWPNVLLGLGAGARPIEALRVKWSELDLDAGTIILRAKKRAREIKMSAWLIDQLKALPKPGDPDEAVCGCNADAKNLRLKRLRETFSLPPHFTFQALRRTAAKRAAPHMTTYQYARYFGHSLAVAEKHYLGYGLTGDQQAVNILNFEPKTAAETAADEHKKTA